MTLAGFVDLQAGREVVLPRADVVLLGGDLAYPNPSKETYRQRLFRCGLLAARVQAVKLRPAGTALQVRLAKAPLQAGCRRGPP